MKNAASWCNACGMVEADKKGSCLSACSVVDGDFNVEAIYLGNQRPWRKRVDQNLIDQ